jgi:hypothetical protein
MGPVMRIVREVAQLFFDDGSLAIAIILVLGATAILSHAAWFAPGPPAAIAFLVGGVVATLVENVVRTARLSRSGIE